MIQANSFTNSATFTASGGASTNRVGGQAGGSGGGGGGVGRIRIEVDAPTLGTIAPPAITDVTPLVSAATFAANQDTKLAELPKDQIRRIRFLVSNAGVASSGAVSYQLEVAETATCSSGSYSAVPTDTSGHWQIIGSGTIIDTEVTLNITAGGPDELTDPVSGNWVDGELKDQGNTAGPFTLAVDDFTEIEFSLEAVTANATTGANYCFRLTNMDTYSKYAEVSIGGTQAPTLATPATTSTDNATLDIDFTLGEAALAGTVKMTFTRTGGSADVNSPHIITFTAAFETAAQHTVTLVGGDLSTSANVASVSSDTNDALVDGAVYDVKIEYQDTVPNAAASVTNSGFTYDTTAPVISATAPAQDATVNTTQVSYTLSEAVVSGTITWTRTGGTADGGSPHAQALAGTELNTGAHSNITLTNNPTLVDGAIYTIAFDVTDLAGNTATTVSNTGVIYDVTTQAPTLASPAGSSTDNATLDIDFTLPEAASSGTVKMTYTQTGGSADVNSPHIITFTAAFESAAQHTMTLVGGDLSTSANVASVSSDTNDALVDGAVYDVKIEYQDGVGNTAASVTNNGFTYDTSAPVISATAPAQDATVNTTQVSYTLSEAVVSGTITWTQTGGTADGGYPHAQALAGTELNTGAHNNITLTNDPTLVDGAIYTIAFDVTDAAGNTATTVSNTGVTYDVTTQAPTLASPAGSSTDNATLDIDFTLPEAAGSGTVKMTYTQTGGSADVNSPHIITFTAAFESAAQHTVTLVGGDLSTSANVASVSSDTNDALVDGGVYDVKIEYQDAVGNTAVSVTNNGFTYDTSAPVISATAPAQDATVNTTQVSYTLSEAVVSGTITWTQTGGTADGGSPHAQALTGAELNTGAHSNITLTNNPTLVDGAIYTIAFDVTDAAGNTATTVSNTGVTYDVTTQAPVLASPAISSSDNATLDIDFTLPEAASSGTVTMTFTQTGGSADVNSPHIITFTAAFETAAQHTVTLVGGDLSTSANVASVSSNTNDALVDGAVYDVKIEYQDAVGNTAASVANSGFTYDTSAPVISATAPAQDATVNTTQVSYTLSEAVVSGTVTWTHTGGTADGGSPHAQALAGTELNTGAHSNITLTNNPTLVDGAIYTIAFDVTDLAGNTATTVSNTGVTYDVTTQAPTLASPTGSSTDNATLDIDFTLPEGASGGTVKMTYTQTGGSADVNSPHIITFTAAFESAAQHTVTMVGGDLSTSANVASVSSDTNDALVDGAVYDVKIEYQDAAGNTAASVTNSGFTYDVSAPVISATAPAQDASVNTTQVSYTLSEAVVSGTITWTRTGGTADGGSPHAQALTGTELNTGAHSNITLTNNPTLVDGAIYTIAFDVTDAAGNTATTVSNTGVIYDVTTQATVLASPAGSSTDNATLDIDFTLPEAASGGTVKMTYTQTGGSADVNSPHIITFTAAFESAAQHTVTMVGGDLSTSANVASVSSDTNDTLVDGAVYDVKIEYQDGVGNTAASVTNNGFTYDVTAPVISATAPAQDATVNTTQVSYTLSEAVVSGTVTWTHTGGTADGGSPHAQALTGTELNTGAHSNITLRTTRR